MRNIADTGLLKAALDADDEYHAWGARELFSHAPFVTCEPVLVELAFLLGTGRPGLMLVQRRDLALNFSVAGQIPRLLELLETYRDRRIDLADACLIRMSELHPRSTIWTVDRDDFEIYRRNGSDLIPCEFPAP